MEDLKIHYLDEVGKISCKSYKTIMDFTDYIEQNPDDFLMKGHHINATFFENKHNTKFFYTMKDLYNFCIEIMK